MRAIPLTHSSTLRPLLEFLGHARGSLPLGWEELEWAVRCLELPIPLAFAGRLYEQAARTMGIGDLGLRVGEGCRIDGIGGFARILRGSRNLGAAVDAVAKLTQRSNTGERVFVTERGDVVSLYVWFSSALSRGRRELCEFSLMLAIRLLRLGAGAAWRPMEIHLEGEKPGHAAALEALAERGARFGQPVTALVFSRDVLGLRIHAGPAERAPRVAPTRAARPPRLPTDFAGSVRSAVAGLLLHGRRDLAGVAEASGMSVRSFQRRLSEGGLSFSQLVEEVRFDVARQRLRDRAVRVVDVAAELGYTDAANFSRAFRRWSGGVSPRQFRLASPRPVARAQKRLFGGAIQP